MRFKPAIAAFAFALFTSGPAQAQGFPPPATWVGTRVVPVVIDSQELMNVPWSDANSAGRLRYSGQQVYIRRIMGSRSISSIGLDFSAMDLRTDATGTDQIRLSWIGSTGGAVRSGTSTSRLSEGPVTGLTAESPGFSFRFDATANTAAASDSSMPNGSGFGYRVTGVAATCCGNSSTIRSLGPYERVTGILMGGEDSFTIRMPTTTGRYTMPVWLEPVPGFSGGLDVVGRCGAAPTPTTFDFTHFVDDVPQAGQRLIDFPSCGSQWFVTFRNVFGGANRAFHFTIGLHGDNGDRDRSDINVGIAFWANPTLIPIIRHVLATAAWEVYGLSGGTQLVREFRIYNEAVACDDGWPAENHACEGLGCNICLAASEDGTISNYNGLGKITMYPIDQLDPQVYAHEIAHWLMDLPDEYARTASCGEMSLCGFSMMAHFYNNVHSLCTGFNHQLLPDDFARDPDSVRLGTVPQCALNACGGTACCPGGGDCDARSSWQRLLDSGRALVAHPARTQENFPYWRFAFSPGVHTRSDGQDFWNRVNAGYLGRMERIQ